MTCVAPDTLITFCDLFIDAMRAIAAEAEANPELVKTAPHATRVGRLDEVAAARKPILRWKPRQHLDTTPHKIETTVVPTA